jgi:hypothetical protein
MEGEKTRHVCDGALSAGVLKLVNTLGSLIEVSNILQTKSIRPTFLIRCVLAYNLLKVPIKIDLPF